MNPLDLLSYASDEDSNDSFSDPNKTHEVDHKGSERIDRHESNRITEEPVHRFHDFPPLSGQSPDPETVRTVEKYLELRDISGFDLTENIRSNKNFGNPYIFIKAVNYFDIDEIGSNYPSIVFNPHGYQLMDFEENIKKRYSNSSHIQHNNNSSSRSVVIQPTHLITVASEETSVDNAKRKKSRWDTAANNGGFALQQTASQRSLSVTSHAAAAGGASAGSFFG